MYSLYKGLQLDSPSQVWEDYSCTLMRVLDMNGWCLVFVQIFYRQFW